jgi:hypothetical protein
LVVSAVVGAIVGWDRDLTRGICVVVVVRLILVEDAFFAEVADLINFNITVLIEPLY